jgi:hypothetical protein
MMTMVISGSDGVTFPDSTNQFSGGAFSFKNRILNGDMRIDQRNAGAAVTANGSYAVDRFRLNFNVSGSGFSWQQDSSAPVGFIKSTKVTVTSSGTPGATDVSVYSQQIEGTNVADLGFGTANAKTVTVSFWVRSSLTGTFSGGLRNSANDRLYPFTYSISSADTWEYKTATIPGDTSGTWLTDTGIGIRVLFDLGSGSDRRATAGAWSSIASGTGATGSVSLVETNGATFYITGVQLEVGSVATPFERRPYGTELALCQRYFQLAGSFIGAGGSADATNVIVSFGTPMRSGPSTSANGALVITDGYTADYTQSSPNASIISTTTLGGFMSIGNFTGLTSGRVYFSRYSNNNSIAFSAEL